MLSGRGLCDELITRPEGSYRLWCVVVCDLETSRMRRPWPALGDSATEIYIYIYVFIYLFNISYMYLPFAVIFREHAVRGGAVGLRHCNTSWKVPRSFSDEVVAIFY